MPFLSLWITAGAALANSIFAIAIFNIRRRETYFHFAISLSATFWSIALHLVNNPIYADSFFWLEISFLFLGLFALLNLLFAYNYISEPKDKNRFYIFNYIYVSLLFIFTLKNFGIIDVTSGMLPLIRFNSVYILYSLLILTALLLSILEYTQKLKEFKKTYEIHIKYAVFGLSLFLGGVSSLTFILPIFFGNSEYLYISSIFSVFYTGILAYCALNRRLSGVKNALAKLIKTAILSIFGTVLIFVYIYGVRYVFRIIFDWESYFASVLFAPFIFGLYKELDSFLELKLSKKITDGMHLVSKTDLIAQFSKFANNELNLKLICSRFTKILGDLLEVYGAELIVYDSLEILAKSSSFKIDRTLRTLKEHKGEFILTIEELKRLVLVREAEIELVHYMELNSYSIIIKSSLQRDVNLFLIIKDKTNGGVFSAEDYENLETIVNIFKTAVSRAILYKNSLDTNELLEKEVKKRTLELEKAFRELQLLDIAKTNFLDMASHQLRTPVSIIRGYISMFKAGDFGQLTKTQKNYIDKVYENIQRLNRVIEEILNITNIESGKFSLKLTKFDIVKLISECYEINKSQAEKKNLKYICNCEGIEREILISGDRDKLFEVFCSLIDNALAYTKEGEVKLVLEIKDERVTFSVADTGIGIPQEERPKLFQKFSRLENAKRIRPDGSGIGLFLAKEIIEAHKGKITVEDNKPQGTIFRVELGLGGA